MCVFFLYRNNVFFVYKIYIFYIINIFFIESIHFFHKLDRILGLLFYIFFTPEIDSTVAKEPVNKFLLPVSDPQ